MTEKDSVVPCPRCDCEIVYYHKVLWYFHSFQLPFYSADTHYLSILYESDRLNVAKSKNRDVDSKNS